MVFGSAPAIGIGGQDGPKAVLHPPSLRPRPCVGDEHLGRNLHRRLIGQIGSPVGDCILLPASIRTWLSLTARQALSARTFLAPLVVFMQCEPRKVEGDGAGVHGSVESRQ